MRVGLLTSYRPHEIGFAWVTLPTMKRYCAIRGYSLAVGIGLSPQAMFDQLAAQFETSMAFLPIHSVIVDPAIPFHHSGKRVTEPPAGLAALASTVADARILAARFPCA